MRSYIIYNDEDDDEDLILRLYLLENIRNKVLKQFYDNLGHMGQDNLFYSIFLPYL